jgi:hypothetical protein
MYVFVLQHSTKIGKKERTLLITPLSKEEADIEVAGKINSGTDDSWDAKTADDATAVKSETKQTTVHCVSFELISLYAFYI